MPRCERGCERKSEDKGWVNRQGRRKAMGFREQNERSMMGNRNVARSRVVQSLEV